MKQFILLITILFASSAVCGIRWATPEQEALDEIHDAEILKAVRTSMAKWEHRKHRRKRADKRVCYGELGCFEDSGPFGYLDMLPSSPEEINTRFLIYSTKNRGDQPLVNVPYHNMTSIWEDLLKSSDDLGKTATRVIVHGFGSSCSHVWVYEMRAALMAVEECTVICVDWENGAILPNYVRAAANARLVGTQLAKLLQGLSDHKGLKMSGVHMIGFSLGAHVAGFAGAQLQGLNRITGLDPAGPLFESQHPGARLDQSDASFVDVIHSNGENLILGGLGSWQPMGHVDFYPNGGRVQHGCSNLFVGAVTDIIWSAPASVEGRSLCNHRRAYKFFTDSVAPRCLFPAFPCDSYDHFLDGSCFPCGKYADSDSSAHCGNMGYYADRSTGRGQLYLLTRDEEPFCAHQYHVRVDSTGGHLPLRSLGRLEITLAGEGGLNETFGMTDKDDTELQAGSSMTRMLVPHPALGPPTQVTLTYKAYSGWLSKGLPHWPINRILIADSFGKSSSVCKRGLILESDRPLTLTLYPGECTIPLEEPEEITDYPDLSTDSEFAESQNSTTNTSILIKREDSGDGNGKSKPDIKPIVKTGDHFESIDEITTQQPEITKADKIKDNDVIKLGEHFKISNNDSFDLLEAAELLTLPWQPLLGGTVNSLDGEAVESSRSLKETEEIVEPLLKSVKGNKNARSHDPTPGEITEPVLSATQKPSSKTNIAKNATGRKLDWTTERSNKVTYEEEPDRSRSVTVQLLPQRLAEVLERAERYARLTLLPLISIHAPRFFGFGDNSPPPVTHVPKYFPPLGEIAEEELEEVKRSKKNIMTYEIEDTEKDSNTNRTAKQESKFYKNNSTISVNISKPIIADDKSNENTIASSAEDSTINSSNQNTPTLLTQPSITTEASKDAIHIDLPTYKPTDAFPYSFEKLTEEKKDSTARHVKSKYIPVEFPKEGNVKIEKN